MQSGDRMNSVAREALTGKPLRWATTATLSPCEIIRLEKETVVRLLHQDSGFAYYFLDHLLTRTARVEADLVDQLRKSRDKDSDRHG